MLNVYLTVDTEIWPEKWDMSHRNFPRYYDQYIRGATGKGEYGLPFQLHMLKEHGLKAVFFVEPLFAHHFGLSPLRDIVSMIQESGQSVELHLHTEWISRTDRVIPPGRFQLNLRDYSTEEQQMILQVGAENLIQSGAASLSAFRAGNFGANRDTFDALPHIGIFIDSSYNLASPLGPCLNETVNQPIMVGTVKEYPVTVFEDGFGRPRHMQIGANSFKEMSTVLEQAHNLNRENVVLFWHSAEFLTRDKNHYDAIAGKRFIRLCEFLSNHADMFSTRHFKDEGSDTAIATHQIMDQTLRASKIDTSLRHGEQLARRLRGS